MTCEICTRKLFDVTLFNKTSLQTSQRVVSTRGEFDSRSSLMTRRFWLLELGVEQRW